LALRHLDRGNQRGDYRGERAGYAAASSTPVLEAVDIIISLAGARLWGRHAALVQLHERAISSLLSGQPGFFQPHFIPPFLQPHGAAGALSIYDTSPLRTTLEALVDFDRINSGKTRLSLGAVNIRLGNFVYFDSTECKITPAM
jgi:hypothetical protein